MFVFEDNNEKELFKINYLVIGTDVIKQNILNGISSSKDLLINQPKNNITTIKNISWEIYLSFYYLLDTLIGCPSNEITFIIFNSLLSDQYKTFNFSQSFYGWKFLYFPILLCSWIYNWNIWSLGGVIKEFEKFLTISNDNSYFFIIYNIVKEYINDNKLILPDFIYIPIKYTIVTLKLIGFILYYPIQSLVKSILSLLSGIFMSILSILLIPILYVFNILFFNKIGYYKYLPLIVIVFTNIFGLFGIIFYAICIVLNIIASFMLFILSGLYGLFMFSKDYICYTILIKYGKITLDDKYFINKINILQIIDELQSRFMFKLEYIINNQKSSLEDIDIEINKDTITELQKVILYKLKSYIEEYNNYIENRNMLDKSYEKLITIQNFINYSTDLLKNNSFDCFKLNFKEIIIIYNKINELINYKNEIQYKINVYNFLEYVKGFTFT